VDRDIKAAAKRYRYTGKERDDESGFYYHGARYYASWLGRWTAADPAGLGGGANLYAYVKNNPILLIDPDGRAYGKPKPTGPIIQVISEMPKGAPKTATWFIKDAYKVDVKDPASAKKIYWVKRTEEGAIEYSKKTGVTIFVLQGTSFGGKVRNKPKDPNKGTIGAMVGEQFSWLLAILDYEDEDALDPEGLPYGMVGGKNKDFQSSAWLPAIGVAALVAIAVAGGGSKAAVKGAVKKVTKKTGRKLAGNREVGKKILKGLKEMREKFEFTIGGTHTHTKKSGGIVNTESHHLGAQSVTPFSKGNAPAIRTLKEIHRKTSSWGSSTAAKEYRKLQKRLIDEGKFDELLEMDVDDYLKAIEKVTGKKPKVSEVHEIQEMYDSFVDKYGNIDWEKFLKK
jgi:RHS repeat-associated protein